MFRLPCQGQCPLLWRAPTTLICVRYLASIYFLSIEYQGTALIKIFLAAFKLSPRRVV